MTGTIRSVLVLAGAVWIFPGLPTLRQSGDGGPPSPVVDMPCLVAATPTTPWCFDGAAIELALLPSSLRDHAGLDLRHLAGQC